MRAMPCLVKRQMHESFTTPMMRFMVCVTLRSGGSMQITVTGKSIELSDVLQALVWQRLNVVGMRYVDIVAAYVTFTRQRRFFTCEIGLHGTNMKELRSVADAANAYHAFNLAIEPLATRLAKIRARRYHRRTEPTAETVFRSLLRNEDDSEEG
jgi:ribosomal subunit interface protein